MVYNIEVFSTLKFCADLQMFLPSKKEWAAHSVTSATPFDFAGSFLLHPIVDILSVRKKLDI